MRSLGVFLLFAVALPLYGQSNQDYAGAKACAGCHASIGREWTESSHSKMFQAATAQSVKGDFAPAKIVLRGSSYVLQQRNGNCYVTESDMAGKPWEHRIDYTLGSRRLQHYLITLADGRTVVLAPTWDIVRKRWIHNLDTQDPDEAPGNATPVWNKSCYSCHVSREQKNFDLERLAYHTTWKDFGIDCETCHGPGKAHVAQAASVSARTTPKRPVAQAAAEQGIVNPARLDPTRSTMVCAQCHSFRDINAGGYEAGANYYDFFSPVLEYRLASSDDPAFWPDGRPRWFANEAVALWESACFLEGGATCVSCHANGHNVDADRSAQFRAGSNTICAKCHAAIAQNISAHTHHSARSAGSSCIECHMPPTVLSLGTRMRDHSISVPVPENTIGHGTPNACNLCHRDKDAEWALQQMNAWYGGSGKGREKLIRRADAFTLARKGDASAIPLLLQVSSELSEGPWIRANAVGYLGGFPDDPSAYDAVLHALADPQPLVRATAAFAVRPRAAQREAVAPQIVSLLADPVAMVRMSAVIALAGMGVHRPPGADGERFDRAVDLYRARAELDSDDAQQQLAAGKFFFLSGDFDGAVAAFRATLKLDDRIPAQYYLARSLVEKGDSQSAMQILQAIPRADPQYGAAQQLTAQLERGGASSGQAQPGSGQATAGTTPQNSSDAAARTAFLDGQVAYENGRYEVALKSLEQALQRAPDAPWVMQANIYRAVCLEKLSRTNEAEAAFEALSGEPAARVNVDLQLAYVELLFDTGRPEEALKRTDALLASVADAPMAYFWRAKVLLQLHRLAEAAMAGEQCVRLRPDIPLAHNLLLRVYQMQGRTKEAAEQAEWLRDYERRVQSR